MELISLPRIRSFPFSSTTTFGGPEGIFLVHPQCSSLNSISFSAPGIMCSQNFYTANLISSNYINEIYRYRVIDIGI